MKVKGHWFCDNCDDVVFMTFERVTQHDVPCPVCGHLSCNFIPARLPRRVIAAGWFGEMRRQVDASTNPELITMR